MDRLKVTSLAFESIMGLPLEDYLVRAREQGMTQEQIARALFIETSGAIEVSHSTIGRWLSKIKGAET